MSEKELSARQRTFVEAFLLSGNATEAAEKAGYRHPAVMGSRLRKVQIVASAIQLGQAKASRSCQVTREEQLELLARIIRADSGKEIDASYKDRIAAMTLRSKMCGELTIKNEHTGKDGAPIQVRTVVDLSLPELERLLQGE